MATLARYEDLGDRLLVTNTNSAKRNVLSDEYYAVLKEAMALATAETRIASVILQGEGGFFCAGGDLRMLSARLELSRYGRRQKIEDLHDVIRAIMTCPRPVIAAVEGGAAGAGVSIAFACDLVVSTPEALFTAAYVNAGLTPDGGMTWTLTRQLPRATLMQIALLGEPITGQRLYDLGAVSRLSETGKALDGAQELANALARGPAAAQTAIKKLVNVGSMTTLKDQMTRERDAMADALVNDESGEGISAFLDKRPANFAAVRNKGADD